MIQCFRLRVVSIALLAGFGFSSRAGEVPISKYDEARDSQAFQLYVVGIESGFSWANADLVRAGKAPLYCQSMDIAMTKEQVLELLDWYVGIIRKDPTFLTQSPEMQAKYSVSFALTRALQARYPCSDKSSTPMQQPAPVIQPVPVYQLPPPPTVLTVPFPSPPGRTTTICRTLSNGTVVCD